MMLPPKTSADSPHRLLWDREGHHYEMSYVIIVPVNELSVGGPALRPQLTVGPLKGV